MPSFEPGYAESPCPPTGHLLDILKIKFAFEGASSWPTPVARASIRSNPIGCRLRPIDSSSRRHAWWSRPRTCTTPPTTVASCSTAAPACGASTPATAATRSSKRSAGKSPRWTTRPRSNGVIPAPSSCRHGSRRFCPATSIIFSMPIRDQRRSTPRSRSHSPITARRARRPGPGSSVASAAITASASAAPRSAASPTTASSSAICLPASTICRTRSICRRWRSAEASRNGVGIWPTISNGWWRCTTRRRSPR